MNINNVIGEVLSAASKVSFLGQARPKPTERNGVGHGGEKSPSDRYHEHEAAVSVTQFIPHSLSSAKTFYLENPSSLSYKYLGRYSRALM